MAPVPIAGLHEAHLTVRDLDRSVACNRAALGPAFAHRIADRLVAFFWPGAARATMPGLREVRTAPLFMRSHIAFRASLADVERSIGALRAAGITPRHGEAPIDQPVVLAWMPAASVRCDDPDAHSLEYTALLEDPPRPEAGTVPLPRWREMQG